MSAFADWTKGVTVAAAMSIAGSMPAMAATFVYVSNAEDGDIGMYRLLDSGELQPGARTKAASVVMPMAVSPDRRLLYAASRSKPFTVHTYAIDSGTGALKPLSTAPLAESFPYITLDKTGRYLLSASYGAHLVSVNAVGSDGRVNGEPLQVIPTARNAHAILTDNTNRFVYVPHLGTDQIFQFVFDPKTGRLDIEHPARSPDEAHDGPAPLHRFARQPVRVPPERAGRDGDDAVARPQDGTPDGNELGFRAAARYEAGAGCAARGGRGGRPAAQHRQRHLGRGPSHDPEREVPLRLGAHQQLAGRVQRRLRDRQAHLSSGARRPRSSRAGSRSTPRAGS